MNLPELFHKKLVLLALTVVGLLLYTGFNVWLFQTNQKKPAVTNQTTNQGASQQASGFLNGLSEKQGNQATSTGQTSPYSPTPTPTPRPTGPGRYACDPNGICGDYGDEQRKSCPVTFADRYCLDSCGDKTKWCSQ